MIHDNESYIPQKETRSSQGGSLSDLRMIAFDKSNGNVTDKLIEENQSSQECAMQERFLHQSEALGGKSLANEGRGGSLLSGYPTVCYKV
jgi:hypothetical protein